jgi:hypothetical protein
VEILAVAYSKAVVGVAHSFTIIILQLFWLPLAAVAVAQVDLLLQPVSVTHQPRHQAKMATVRRVALVVRQGVAAQVAQPHVLQGVAGAAAGVVTAQTVTTVLIILELHLPMEVLAEMTGRRADLVEEALVENTVAAAAAATLAEAAALFRLAIVVTYRLVAVVALLQLSHLLRQASLTQVMAI